MRKASLELINLLHSTDQFYIADLYTFELTDGTILRYTSADIDLKLSDGREFLSSGPQLERDGVTHTLGLEVAEMNVDITSNGDIIPGGLTIIQALRAGAFDGAFLTLELLFLPNWQDTSIPPLVWFVGEVNVEEVTRYTASIKAESLTKKLNIKQPRNLVMPSCGNTLFDSACGLNKNNYGVNGKILPNGNSIVLYTSLVFPAAHFDAGTITFTSGSNTNVSRTIKGSFNGQFSLIYPLPNTPEIGDTFIAYPGCNKTRDCCQNKFNNIQHFRGCPYVPMPETLL